MSDEVDHEPEQFRKVFIGGLSYKTTDEGLRAFYSQWGELIDCVVMVDKVSGKSRGFGFVTYAEPSMVDEAMENRPHTIDGRTVQPKRAVPRGDSGNPGVNVTVNKIFIGGIRDKPVSKEDLEMYFGCFGRITDCVIMMDKETNKPRGFAFVEFDDYDPVDQIILRKHHQVNGVHIDVKKALPRESASGEPPRGGSRGGGFSSQQRGGGGGGWRSGGRESEGGRRSGRGGGGAPRGGGTGAASSMSSYGYGANGYGKENSGWNHNQSAGWNPNVADPNAGYDQSCGTAYPGYGQPSSLQHQQQPPLQQNYGVGSYGSDFGQNYGQQQGGGPMKGSSGGRPNPYGPPVNYGN